MGQSIEILAGQSAALPAGSYMDAKLTGELAGIRLRVLDSDDRDAQESRHSDAEVAVRPNPSAGSLRLVAVPTSGGMFERGARLGLELKAGAGVTVGPQILVGQNDVGAYAEVELALVEYDQVNGWRVTAAGGLSGSTFDFLSDGEAATAALDERQYAWIGPGRYALRRARGGSVEAPTEEPWALVVDSSASMRPVFSAASLEVAVELVAGVLSELTGKLPQVAGVTGRSRPEWVRAAVSDPATLIPEVLSTTQPASWSLLLPALAEATASGARTVVFLLDGAPSDLENLSDFLEAQPGVTVAIVVAARPAPEVAGQASADEASVLMSFDHVTRFPHLRVAHISVTPEPLADDTAARLAAALAGVSA